MSQTRQVLTLIAALTLAPLLAEAQGGAKGGQRGYQEYDSATHTTFTATVDATGNAVLTLKGGDFALEKVVAHTGDATLRLSQGKDVVTIAVNQNGFEAARGRKSVRIDPRHDKHEKFDAVRALLTGSHAVRSFKRLVASIEHRDESEQDGALALTTLVDGAMVLLLDGDEEAPRRLAKRLTRTLRAGMRAASAKRAPGAFVDCVYMYQVALMSAWEQWEDCYVESTAYRLWTRDLFVYLCSFEWTLRAQQYIWQFVGCFTVPF